MKRKVGRVEARIIMRNAKEFRAKQAALVETPEPVVVPEVLPVQIPAPVVLPEPVAEPPKKKSFLTYVIDFFKKKGT